MLAQYAFGFVLIVDHDERKSPRQGREVQNRLRFGILEIEGEAVALDSRVEIAVGDTDMLHHLHCSRVDREGFRSLVRHRQPVDQAAPDAAAKEFARRDKTGGPSPSNKNRSIRLTVRRHRTTFRFSPDSISQNQNYFFLQTIIQHGPPSQKSTNGK